MQISTLKNQNLEKLSRNPSKRTIVKILKKKNFWISLKKCFVPRMLSVDLHVKTVPLFQLAEHARKFGSLMLSVQ